MSDMIADALTEPVEKQKLQLCNKSLFGFENIKYCYFWTMCKGQNNVSINYHMGSLPIFVLFSIFNLTNDTLLLYLACHIDFIFR